MLAEMLLYRLTRAEPWADRLGLREGAVRLWSRHGRCRRAWMAHLDNTRRFVAAAAAAAPGNRTALVLGSGLLADVPLEALRARFARVVLVDAVHLAGVRWRLRKAHGVELAVADLSGVAAALARDEAPVEPACRFGLDDPTIDFVVSLNLVSQLPLAPYDWLVDRLKWDEGAAGDYARKIVAAHFDHLAAFKAPVCVVGDRARVFLDRSGRPAETEDALWGYAPPPADAEWIWDVAPLGEHDRNFAIRNHVFAIRELRANRAIV